MGNLDTRHEYIGCMIDDSHEFSIIRHFLFSSFCSRYQNTLLLDHAVSCKALNASLLHIPRKCYAVCHTRKICKTPANKVHSVNHRKCAQIKNPKSTNPSNQSIKTPPPATPTLNPIYSTQRKTSHTHTPRYASHNGNTTAHSPAPDRRKRPVHLVHIHPRG